jgi:hypothetical protein
MDSLSTELDDNIVHRLGIADLNALSRTSKYYAAITEPFLYQDLTFSE